ncbi:hypothetical protein Dsin_024006 [Dipteronia sinensis]|uniref:Uncharacterized protein n=1 Tax=Dipteronia sinensis TaxID=43782 RepID=A0AAE0E1G2_9ROSI|nr:hypothetical protein Dsin_024006 [Dipteronia sinensis]
MPELYKKHLGLDRIDSARPYKRKLLVVVQVCNLLKLIGCLWFFKLPEDLGNLVNMHKLELDDIFWFKSSTELHIFNYMGNSFPNWITGGLLQHQKMQELEQCSDETCMYLLTPSLPFLILNDNPVHEDLNERILKLITQSDQGQDDEGLPTEIKRLIIVSCSSLKSLGTKGTLKSLNSLKDLHIEDFPLLLSSLQHLRIQDCPSGTENEQGPECTKISHIPDRETDFIRSQHPTKKKAHSAAWSLPFLCSGG